MDNILLACGDGIATVTLNRPKALNAINADLARELRKTLERVEADSEVRCVVLQGAGSSFMAGGDIALFKNRLQGLELGETTVSRTMFDNVNGSIRALRRMPKPVLASVQGAVAGFGLSLMNACDLIVAAESSVFFAGYGQVGLNPDGGGTHFLPRTLGLKRTMEMVLLGEQYSAQQMRDMGMLNRVVPGEELAAETERLATKLAAGPAIAAANAKRLVNTSFETPLEAQLLVEEEGVHQCTRSADFAEGVSAFLEKRRARFACKPC